MGLDAVYISSTMLWVLIITSLSIQPVVAFATVEDLSFALGMVLDPGVGPVVRRDPSFSHKAQSSKGKLAVSDVILPLESCVTRKLSASVP